MALFTIADLHLSLGGSKPMDIFGGWQGYVQRLEENWRKSVTAQDTVVIGGDISWAMRLEDTLADFTFLQSLPGQKILIKGNHDYWWTTMAKMNNFLQQNSLHTLNFLLNNSFLVGDVSVCGTRSWLFEAGQAQDVKVMQREVGRLRASLQTAQTAEKIVFLHYPPLFVRESAPEIINVLKEFDVKRCYYGHLHGASIQWAVQGNVEGIQYKLVSADSLSFVPFPIQANASVHPNL